MALSNLVLNNCVNGGMHLDVGELESSLPMICLSKSNPLLLVERKPVDCIRCSFGIVLANFYKWLTLELSGGVAVRLE